MEKHPPAQDQPPVREAASKRKTHFIPFSKKEIVRLCLEEGRLPTSDHETFVEFAPLYDFQIGIIGNQ